LQLFYIPADHLTHISQMHQDIPIAEPENSNPISLKFFCPLLIIKHSLIFIMLPTVSLNSKSIFRCIEINNITPTCILPSEFYSCNLPISKGGP